MDEAKNEGSIEDDEHTLLQELWNLDDENVSTILTPRVDVEAVDIDYTDDEIEEVFEETSYSRLIVMRKL